MLTPGQTIRQYTKLKYNYRVEHYRTFGLYSKDLNKGKCRICTCLSTNVACIIIHTTITVNDRLSRQNT